MKRQSTISNIKDWMLIYIKEKLNRFKFYKFYDTSKFNIRYFSAFGGIKLHKKCQYIN